MSKLRIAIHGAAGRMGRRLVALASTDAELQVAAALESPHSPLLNHDAGSVAGVGPLGVQLQAHLNHPADVVIDFSLPDACAAITSVCVEHKIPLVVATTGLELEHRDALRHAAETIPIVWAPSMSLAVNLTMKLAAIAAKVLKDYPEGCDVEIIERHHRFKEDAPSGTALKFGQIVTEIMGQEKITHGREGRTGARPRHEIGYHALRVGDNPGEHTIVFGLLGETVELNVKASNRDCYAFGALAAAKFVVNQPPGLYNMYDVLGL